MSDRRCVTCQASIEGYNRRRVTCSASCARRNSTATAKRWVAARSAERAARPKVACRNCGGLFRQRTARHLLCRPACGTGGRTCIVCQQPSGSQPWCSLACRAANKRGIAARAELPPHAAPTRCNREPDDSGTGARSERRLRCRQYDVCLSYVARHDWPDFHCAACPVRDELTDAELSAEIRAHVAISRQHSGSIWDNCAIESVDLRGRLR